MGIWVVIGTVILIQSSSARLTLPWINRFYLFSPYSYGRKVPTRRRRGKENGTRVSVVVRLRIGITSLEVQSRVS
jgi:hypothetical protein